MIKITNTQDIGLPIAVWLLHDEYDYINEPNYISVTGLMKPLRQIILPSRVPPENRELDLSDLVAQALGKAIHDSIEKAWTKNPQHKLRMLGYPQHIIDLFQVNPTDEQILGSNGSIDVHLEKRAIRSHQGRRIGGKFDLTADGIVQDFKSTSAFAWAGGTRDEEHILQLSLYRWIDAAEPVPKITQDFGVINYIFTDWSKMMARSSEKYPKKRVEEKRLPLLSLDETENWVNHKLALIDRYHDTPEHTLPECTDEELWRSDPKYRYFSDPTKANDPNARSSKNFDTLFEANQYLAEKAKGIIITKPGEVKRCGYCPAFEACTQKDQYL